MNYAFLNMYFGTTLFHSFDFFLSQSGKLYRQGVIGIAALGLSMLLSNPTYSNQVGSPYIKNFDRKDYQSGTQNWHIGAAQQGFVYFGNNKGILEYDGTSWHTYKLPNYSIARSFAFSGDSILVGGQNEIGYLKADRKGMLTYHSLSPNLPDDIPEFDDVWKIFLLDQNIYFCTEKVIIKRSNDNMDIIKPPGGRFENFFVSNGRFLVQDLSKGLYELNGKSLNLIQGSDIFRENRIVAMLSYALTDSTLFVTRNGNVYFFYEDKFSEWDIPSSTKLKLAKPYCAINLKNGNFAIGTSQNGLVIIDNRGLVTLQLNKDDGLQNNTILSLYQDIHNNLWLGLDNGIDYIEINSSFRVIGPEKGIEGTGYTSYYRNNTLYFGTNQGLFQMPWGHGRLQESMEFQPVEEGIGQVWNINEIFDQVLVSKHDGAYFLKENGLERFSDIQGSWKFAEHLSKPGYIIQGTYTGLNIYHAEDNGSINLHARLDGFNESARVFEQDKNGRIWVSHAYKGLYSLDLSDDLKSIRDIHYFDTAYGLPDNLFINVTRLRNEVLFTSTSGIYRFDESTQRFVEHEDFTKIFGAGRNIHRMLEDELGNIWFSIDKEFGVLTIEERGVFNDYKVHFFNQIQESVVDGFEDVYALDQNNIFLGSERGFIHYNPGKAKSKEISFSTHIRQIDLITDGDSAIYYSQGMDTTEREMREFSYEQNDFKFSFSTPYYDKMEYIEYRYKLEGFENEWSEWSGNTQKEYTNLSEGPYEFMVQARNAYGEISRTDSFSFYVNPPWYLNIYFKIAYVIISLSIFTLILRWIYAREARKRHQLRIEQKKQIKNKEEEFKKEFEKSESEIVKLRNEKLQADVNHKNSQLASATMHLVQKSELLISLKNEIKSLLKEAPQDFRKKLQQIARAIDDDIQLDNNWDQFEHYFDQVHENFFKRLRQYYPNLTPKDQKLCAYLRMNLSTKEIAPLLNISVRGVEISRYRLRKKLDLDSNANLVAHIMEI